MTNPITLRPVARAELPTLKQILDLTELFPSEMLDAMIAPWFDEPGCSDIWLTACLQDQPLGLLYCAPERMTEGTWNLYAIAVHPAHQGQGTGTMLVAELEKQLRAAGARILLVETSGLDQYARTRSFYHRIGYDEHARIAEFYAAGEDKVIFRKIL